MTSNNARLIGLNWWKGYQMLVIDEVAGNLPPAFLNEVLYRCSESGASLELCVFSGEDKRSLSVAFILRCEDNSRYAVCGRLDDLTQALLPQFEEAGFTVHVAEPNDETTRMINRFFGGDLAPGCVGKGFFPEDKLLGARHFYAPGEYTRAECDPISWERLNSIITRYSTSMMCIQLINTSLSPVEEQFLQNCKNHISQFKNDYAATQAAMAYDQKLKLRGRRLYFVNMFCIGSDLFTSDVSAQMRTWKYRTFGFPPATIQDRDYLFLGDGRFKADTTEYGHMAECKKAVLSRPNNQFHRLTHLIPMETVAELFPLPYDPGSIPTLKVKRFFSKPVRIPEESQYKDNAQMLYLGAQEGSGVRFGMQLGDLRKHGFIVGKSGCGKTTFAMGLLKQLDQLGIPFLVVEPAKCEYRSLLGVIKNLRIYTPGVSSVAPIQLNPFMPPKGVTLEEYLPVLTTIFDAAISMDHPLDVIFPQVIRICYNRYGWRPNSTRDSQGVTPFGMSEFTKCFQEYIREQYADDKETRANFEAGGVIRLTQLTSEHPVLFDTVNALDFDEVLKYPTIIELDAIKNDQQRSLIMMTIMVQALLCIQQRSTMDSRLQNIILIDEAHLLLGGNASTRREGAVDSSSACVRYLQDAIKILRSYGVGVFFGDQSPKKLTRDIMEHVNLKIMFQQDSPQDREILSSLTRMDGDMQEDMIDLRPGYGYVFLNAGLDKPVKIYAPNYKKELALRKNVSDTEIAQLMNIQIDAPFPQCTLCKACSGRCTINLRSDAKFIADRMLASSALAKVLQEEEQLLHLSAFMKTFPQVIARCVDEQGINWPNPQRLHDCTAVQLLRGLLLSGKCRLEEQELIDLILPRTADAPAQTNPQRAFSQRKLGTTPTAAPQVEQAIQSSIALEAPQSREKK